MEALEYFRQEGLDSLLVYSDSKETGSADNTLPPDVLDLTRIHRLIRERKSFTVMEFGVGFSTLVIADALKKNKAEWDSLKEKPVIRNRFMFHCFSIDASEFWIGKTKERVPESLSAHITFHFSKAKAGTHNGQLCHFYESLPDVVPDFIYLDGPDPKSVEGTVNGMSFQCDERTVVAADLLLMEPTFLPGTFILVDGRTNNVRFLQRNFRRNYNVLWDKKGDVTTFELDEERLGIHNILGTDILR